jgi:predicted Zn-dependent peptidase
MNPVTGYVGRSGGGQTLPGGAAIEHERYQLANGMQVILHQDRKAPIVHVLVWYHVGSKNEPADRTGFAHLFEHMMFQGSEHVGKTEHFKHVQGVGGSLNASTSQDRTDYFETLPREYLGLGLWLEADRMRSLNVTEENFQNQLAVVKEERKQNYDNRPYGLWYLTLLEMLYQGTSYAWGPIGEMAHLDASPIDSVREFHGTYYRPNNATLVVSGDFDTAEAKRLIEEQFGAIAAGPPIDRPQLAVEPLRQQVRRTITARVPLPSVYIGYHSVPVGHPDSAPLGMLSIILGKGRSSRLQRQLVYDHQIAQNVMVFDNDQESGGLFVIQAVASQRTSVEELERELWKELETIADRGIEERELQGALNYVETMLVRSLAHVSGVSTLLARYQVFCGDSARANELVKEYASVTVQDVRRVARQYLRPESAAVLYYLPETAETGT